MKEYTITMSFQVEADKSKLEKITQFADDLTQKILEDNDLVYHNDIKVVDIVVEDIQDHNDDYDDDDDDDNTDYLMDDDDDF